MDASKVFIFDRLYVVVLSFKYISTI